MWNVDHPERVTAVHADYIAAGSDIVLTNSFGGTGFRLKLSGESYIAFVQHPDNSSEIQYGVSHAGNPGAPVTGGATQHIAMHVDSLDEVLAMRDRIRSNGVHVMGPIDHGMIKSIYFAGDREQYRWRSKVESKELSTIDRQAVRDIRAIDFLRQRLD